MSQQQDLVFDDNVVHEENRDDVNENDVMSEVNNLIIWDVMNMFYF